MAACMGFAHYIISYIQKCGFARVFAVYARSCVFDDVASRRELAGNFSHQTSFRHCRKVESFRRSAYHCMTFGRYG